MEISWPSSYMYIYEEQKERELDQHMENN